MRSRVLVALSLLVAVATAERATAAGPTRLRLSTTTSTDQTGLLKVVLPPFERRHGIRVEVIAVGSGKALKLAENGDVDVVLSHAPALEEEFVRAGFGVDRRAVMANDFVIVGPAADPAGVRGATSASQALRLIAASRTVFVSRGDESGTHQKERELWLAAGVEPAGPWYLAAGQGMGPVLLMADERRGYTLADRASHLTYAHRSDLAILHQGDPALLNPYSVIATHPARHPSARHAEAKLLIDWLTSPQGQRLIGEFSRDGVVLFRPTAEPLPPRP